MFTGTYFVEIDKKHRLIIPSRLRSELWKLKEKSLEVYLTLSQREGKFLILLFSLEVWQDYYRQLLAEHREQFCQNSYKVKMDRQGRVVIPEELRKYFAGELEGVELRGVGNHIEMEPKKKTT